MLSRTIVLIIVTVFVVAFAGLTVDTVAQQGFRPVTVIAVIVLAMFVFGGIGALRQPPRE